MAKRTATRKSREEAIVSASNAVIPPVVEQRLSRIEDQMSLIVHLLNRDNQGARDGASMVPAPQRVVPDAPSIPSELDRRLPAELYRAEPRRQRKNRNMPARKTYSLKEVKSAGALRALQEITPAASSILVYLASHPRATVGDLVTQLDLRRKTVENLLSTLRLKDLVHVEDVR